MLLSYSSFIEEFIIHIDSSKMHLGGLISQKGKLISFYSQKQTSGKINYTTTERELLNMVRTLK